MASIHQSADYGCVGSNAQSATAVGNVTDATGSSSTFHLPMVAVCKTAGRGLDQAKRGPNLQVVKSRPVPEELMLPMPIAATTLTMTSLPDAPPVAESAIGKTLFVTGEAVQ